MNYNPCDQPFLDYIKHELKDIPHDEQPLEASILSTGFYFRFNAVAVLHGLDDFKEFIGTHNHFNFPITDSADQNAFIAQFLEWQGGEYAEKIERGELKWKDIRNDYAHLLDTSAIQMQLAKDVMNNKNIDPGKPQSCNSDLLNLMGWAAYHYKLDTEQTLKRELEKSSPSLLDACVFVIEKYPELIPKNWNAKNKDFPEIELAENLRKEIYRSKFSKKYGLKTLIKDISS